MNESTTLVYRPMYRRFEAFKCWIRMKLLQVLGVDQEIRRLQALTASLEAKLDTANELVRDLATPNLPEEFFDDTEILVTQRYDVQ